MPQTTLSEIDLWRTGFPLETAWRGLATSADRERYRQLSGDALAIRTQYVEMVGKLWVRLSSGELTAYGLQVSPPGTGDPISLPVTMFSSTPTQTNLDAGCLCSHGWCFEQVRVAAPAEFAVARMTTIPNAKSKSLSAAKRGRPRNDTMLIEAARQLATLDMEFLRRSAEKQNFMIVEKAGQLFPGKFSNPRGPGRSTVARFLQEQRDANWPALYHPKNPEIPK